MEKKLSELLPLTNINKTKQIIANYKLEVSQPGFWDNNNEAKRTMHELESKKEFVSMVESWVSSLENMKAALDILSVDEYPDLTEEADRTLNALDEHIEDWKLESMLTGPYDSRSCRLTVRSGAGGVDAQVYQ